MKKLITSAFAAAAALFSAHAQDGTFPMQSLYNPSLEYLHASASVGVESQYVFRGEKLANCSIQPQVELLYPVAGFDITGGAWFNAPLYGSKYDDLSELDLYADVAYKYKSLTVKAGYIYYWYTSGAGPNKRSNDMEVYGGISFDTAAYMFGNINLNPSIFYFYNWVLNQQTVELSFSYDFEIGELIAGWSKLKMPIGLYSGYVSAGDKGRNGEGVSYFYYGVQVDLAYELTPFCTISGGVRWSQRSGGEDFDYFRLTQYPLNGAESNIWFGGRISFGF